MFMKQILTLFFCVGIYPLIHGQTITSINSGAVSNNNLVYTVGEVFVVSTNSNESNSGFVGAISRIEFTALGISEIVFSEKLRFYPNPTSDSVFFDTENKEFNSIFIYDINGRLICNKKVINNQVDLSNLETGTYLIKTDNQNIQTFKILKK
jgi:hypothetical protein